MKQSGTNLPPRNINVATNASPTGKQGMVNSQMIPPVNQTYNNTNQMINPASNLGPSANQIYPNPNLIQNPGFPNQANQPTLGSPLQPPAIPNPPGYNPKLSYEDMTNKIQSNIQGLVNQLNSLQDNLLSTSNNNYKNLEAKVIKNSPRQTNLSKGGLINEITPEFKKQPDPIPSYPLTLNTTFPSFPEIVEHPLFPSDQSNSQNERNISILNQTFGKDNPSNINNIDILRSQNKDSVSLNQPPMPDPMKIRILESVYQPLEKVLQATQAGIATIKNQLEIIGKQSQNAYPSPIKSIIPSNITTNEFIHQQNYYRQNPNINSFIIHPLWQKKIKENITLDPSNEEKVVLHLHELITDPFQMSELIDSIFLTLNNSTNLLSSIEFKEFYDLTSSGMNAPQLDTTYIMNEYLFIPKADPLGISKSELKLYVSKMYQAIINFAQSYINQPK